MGTREAVRACLFSGLTLPVISFKICAGFPSPADDYLDEPINIEKLLSPNPPATFLWWVEGHSMKDAGIYNGDLLVVDRSLHAVHNDVVVAVVDGERSLKRLDLSRGEPRLFCDNSSFPPYQVGEGSTVEIWGVVRCNVHWLGQRKP